MKSGEPTRQEIALNALADVRALLDNWEGSDWACTNPAKEIDHILRLAYVKLRMNGLRRDRRSARWIAQVKSTVFPRKIPWRQDEVTALCFEVYITDGAKDAVGRKVEVRLSANDADFLARSMAGMAEWAKDRPGPADVMDELLPGGSMKEEDGT